MTARHYQITYAGYSVGTSGADAYLHMPYDYKATARNITVTFIAIIAGSNQVDLRAKQTALETAFKTRFADLELQRFGGAQSFSQSNNTGFNILSECNELDDPKFTGLLRAYRCSVSVQLPINDRTGEPGEEGLVDYSITVTESPSKQPVVVVAGVYNAIDTDVSAVTRLKAELDTLLDVIEADVDVSAQWERSRLRYTPDRFNKIAEFSINTAKIIDRQSLTLKDDPDIVEHSLAIRMVRQNQGYSYVQTSPLQEAVAVFQCAIDSTETTDLPSVWRKKIYPLLLAEAAEHIENSKIIAVGSEAPVFSTKDNTISINLSLVIRSNSTIVESFESIAVQEQKGVKLIPTANQRSAFSGDLVTTAAVARRQITRGLVVNGDEAEARRRMADFIKASSAPKSGKRAKLNTGKGGGSYPGKGRALRPNEVPDFGASGGYWIDDILQEPELTTLVIGVTRTTKLTRITQVISGFYYVPSDSGIASVER